MFDQPKFKGDNYRDTKVNEQRSFQVCLVMPKKLTRMNMTAYSTTDSVAAGSEGALWIITRMNDKGKCMDI